MREFHARNPERRKRVFIYRVVQHDRPEQLRLEPEVEREVKLREIVRKLGVLAITAGVFGLTWAVCEAILLLAGKR